MSAGAEPRPRSGLVDGLLQSLAQGRAELTAQARAAAEGEGQACERLGMELGRAQARLFDEALVRLVSGLGQGSEMTGALLEASIAGVGSYGRGAVALRSDLDLRVLRAEGSSSEQAAVVAELLYPLWDAGLSVGHQVVTVDELVASAREDLPTATALLDWRHVVGDRAASVELRERMLGSVFAHSELPAFMLRLRDEVSGRHQRFGGSVYLLEPDVKNGAGGLRDLDVALWAARARFGSGELRALVRFGALLGREVQELEEARELVWRIRNILHLHAGRRSDRLTFHEQEAIALALGYGEGPEAVELLMSTYYRAARTISQSLEVVLDRATPALSRRRPHDEDLGEGLRLFDGSLSFSDPEQLSRDPALALRILRVGVERSLPILSHARSLIRRVADDASWCETLRGTPEAVDLFRRLVCTVCEVPLRAGSPMRELHDLGLLLAMVPEFRPLIGRVHHDVYHVYTVDVHSVAAVDRLGALARGDVAGDFPLACRLAAERSRPHVLFFATLLHDVGKSIGGKDHSERGALMAREILGRLGLDALEIEEACHLIREHLAMYRIATRRDLDDPSTIEEFRRSVRTHEELTRLYLLTVVDVSTTSPTSMTSWKSRMLDELFLATEASMTGTRVEETRQAQLESEVEPHLGEAATCHGVEPGRLRAFLPGYLRTLPERYGLTNAPQAIAAHAALALAQGEGEPAAQGVFVPSEEVVVGLVPSRHPEAAEVCVVASDRPGLLAAITASLAASRLEVHAAQIHSRVLEFSSDEGSGPPRLSNSQAVDLFWVRDRGEGVEGVARALPKLQRDLASVLRGEVSAATLARRRVVSGSARSAPRVPTKVVLDGRASPRHTVLEVTTRDRPGVLFAIADALHRAGLSIAVAKINTEGARVADVFYVSEEDGSKLATAARAAEVEACVLRALEELEQGEGRGER